MTLTFGIYKGRKIQSMTSINETQYLYWLYASKFGAIKLKQEIKKFLNIR